MKLTDGVKERTNKRRLKREEGKKEEISRGENFTIFHHRKWMGKNVELRLRIDERSSLRVWVASSFVSSSRRPAGVEY